VAIDNKRIVVVDRGNERIQLFSRTGQILAVVGKFGFGNGEFNYPSGVAMDSRGRIFVADSYNNRIQRFDASGRFERHWGEWGSYSGLFATPTGLAFADNKLFVTDLINHRVQVFDVDGKYLFQWGRHPPTGHEGNGRLHYPTTIATAKSGKWSVVCEPFEYRCQVFSSLSLAAAKNVDDKAWWDKGARFHYGARVKSTGALLTIAEPDTHSVLVFDNSFETPQLITRIGGQGRDVGSFIRPSGMAIDEAKGQIIVSDGGNHRLETFELTKTGGGQVSTFAPNVSRAVSAFSVVGLGLPRISPQGFDASTQSPVEPGALLRDKAGLLYMADPHNARIVVFDQKMNVVRMFGTRGTEHGQLLIPNDLAFSVDGETLFVVDTYNFRLVAFSREGKFLFDWGKAGIGKSEFMHAFGIAAGRDGYVYVTDDAANRVQKFDEKGNFISAWGRWGTEPGQFYKPKGITQDDRGRIIIADFGNHRGQIMTANGDYIGMFGIGEGYTPPLTALKAEVEKNNSRDELSNGGNYLVHYDLLDGTIELNKPFSMLLTIRTTSGASLAKDVSLSVSATMPAHYHGMSTEPRVTRQSDGRWKVEGMLLHMQGAWQVNFDISEKKAVERAQIDLLIK
jgi:tripartite motif-containing protein 71